MINSKLNTNFNINNYLIAPAEIIYDKLISNKEDFLKTLDISNFNKTITVFLYHFYKNKSKLSTTIETNIVLFVGNESLNFDYIQNILKVVENNVIYHKYNYPIYFLIYYIINKIYRIQKLIKIEVIIFNILINKLKIEKDEKQKIFILDEYKTKIINSRQKFLLFNIINYEYMNSILNFDMLRQEQLTSIYDLREVIGKTITSDGIIRINKLFTKTKKPEILQIIFLSNINIRKEIKIKQNIEIDTDYVLLEDNKLTIDKNSYKILFNYFLELPYNRAIGK